MRRFSPEEIVEIWARLGDGQSVRSVAIGLASLSQCRSSVGDAQWWCSTPSGEIARSSFLHLFSSAKKSPADCSWDRAFDSLHRC
jgi:hypothetical protein